MKVGPTLGTCILEEEGNLRWNGMGWDRTEWVDFLLSSLMVLHHMRGLHFHVAPWYIAFRDS